MWQLFGAEIGRFSILVIASLIIFGLFWLYFDAWRVRKVMRTIPLLLGLLLLSISFLAQGMSLETRVLSSVWQGNWTSLIENGYLYIRGLSYLLMIVGLWLTPIEDRPKL